MHAPKNGIFYVLDAKTGKFISGKNFVPTVNWMTGFDANGRPILNPEANYAKTNKGFYLIGFQSHVWNPMSFSPHTGLVYLPTSYGSYPYVSELGAPRWATSFLGINIKKAPGRALRRRCRVRARSRRPGIRSNSKAAWIGRPKGRVVQAPW